MMEIRPITLRAANEEVARLHRHHKPARGCKFCISAWLDGSIVGVAIVGRPVARMLDDGLTAEVVRVATDGTKNACSKLYGAAWRAARAMGYRRLVTYTLIEEPGTSLRAAGWRCLGEAGGGELVSEWTTPRGQTPNYSQAPMAERASGITDKTKGKSRHFFGANRTR
jgi:hypothetical protein